MADGKINLTFSTHLQPKGLNELSNGVKEAVRGIKDLGDAGTKVVGALTAQMSGPLADAANAVSGVFQGIVQAGVWGAIAVGVTTVVGKLVEWRESAKKAREEHLKLVEAMTAGHARRWEQTLARMRKREEEVLAAIVKTTEALLARMDKIRAARESLGAAEDAGRWAANDARSAAIDLVALQDSAGRSKGDAGVVQAKARLEKATLAAAEMQEQAVRDEKTAELRLKDAEEAAYQRRELYYKGLATEEAVQDADNQVKIATLKLAEVRDKMITAEMKGRAGILEAEKSLAEAEAAARREEEARLAEARVRTLKDMEARSRTELSVMDRALAAQKILADAWEKRAQKARGKDFAVWLGETEAEEKAAKDERLRFDRANAGAGRRAQNIRRRGIWASARDKSWLARYDEWKAAQDPANNSAAKDAEKLEAERAKKVAEIANLVERVAEELKNANTQG